MTLSDKIWLIQGDGVAGWAAAALLTRALSPDHSVVVVEDAAARAGDGLDVILADPNGALVQLANGAEDDLLAEAQARFSLGVLWRAWRAGQDIAVAHQEPLPTIDGIAVQDVVLRAAHGASSGLSYADLLAPLQFQARAMTSGRYAHPSPDRQSPRSLLKPQLVLEGQALSSRLRTIACRSGAVCVSQTEAQGLSPFMTLDTRPAAAFPGAGDWTTRLGHDRQSSLRCRPSGDLPPYIEVRALPEGLATRTALPRVDILNLNYDGRTTTPDQAHASLARLIGEAEILETVDAPASSGWLQTPWNGERLAFGPAAARFGLALGSGELDEQLRLLASHLPGARDQIPACASAYNQALVRDLGHRADRLHLIQLMGPAGDRLGAAGSDLQRRIDLFQSRNGAVALDGDPYDSQHWVMLMGRLGLTPHRYDVQADRLDQAQALASLGRMVMAFDQTLAALPSHETALNSFRRSAPST